MDHRPHSDPASVEASALSASPAASTAAAGCAAGPVRLGADKELSDEPLPKRRCSGAAVADYSPAEEGPSGMQQQQPRPPCSDTVAAAAEAQAHIELVASLKAQAEALARAAEEETRRRRLLEEELAAARQQSEVLRLEVARARSDALDGVAQLVESELQCCICSELMVKAKSLSCSHSFCSFCIDKWLEQKKECPVCRERFTSSSLSYALDSYIDKVVEQMSEEKQASRRQLVDQRKAEQDAACSKGKKKQKRSGSGSASTAAASAERSAGRRNGAGTVSAATASAAMQPVSEQQLPFAYHPAPFRISVTHRPIVDNLTGGLYAWAEALPWSDVPDSTMGNPFVRAVADAQGRAAPAATADAAASHTPGGAASADAGRRAAAPDADVPQTLARPRTRAQARSLASPVVVHDDSSEEETSEEVLVAQVDTAAPGHHSSDGGDSESNSLADAVVWPPAPGDVVDDDYDDGSPYYEQVAGDVSGTGRRPPRVLGLPGAYYGGYGTCYCCGNRGHWANGCPFR